MSCIICNSDAIEHQPGQLAKFILHRIGVPATETSTIQCQQCGFRYSSVRFTDAQAQAIYGDYRTDRYFAERELFEPGFMANYGHHFEPRNFIDKVEAFIRPHKEPATVLDIGGGNGENTPFRDRATIVDIGDTIEGHYDLVIMSHLLEHVGSPHRFVELARKHLKTNGLIYTETPIDGPINVWHEHCQVFTEQSLRILLHPMIDYREDRIETICGIRMTLSTL
jgi:SAM-dependent methyltransferase